MGDEEDPAAFLLRGDHTVTASGGERKRLLQEHMLPGLERGDRVLGVEMRRQRVADGVDRGVIDDRQIVGGRATADFVGELLRFVEVERGDGRHLDALHLGVGARMPQEPG